MSNEDTIISIATPMGTGAISIIRCSGSNINQIMRFFFKKELTPRLANYADFKIKGNTLICPLLGVKRSKDLLQINHLTKI